MDRETKNAKIKETYALTRERRMSQIPLTFRMKVRNEKRNKRVGVFDFLKMCFVEGKWIWNSIIAQTDRKLGADARKLSSFTQKEFKSVTHKDRDNNDVTSEVTHLGSSMRDAVIESAKRAVKGLSTKKKNNAKKKKVRKTDRVGHLKFKSEITSINLKQYGITHQISGPNSYHIQGFDKDIRVAGMRQLRHLEKIGIEYELASAVLQQEAGDCYILQTVYVDRQRWLEYKESRNAYKHDRNSIDMGCLKTATDAFGNVYNCQIEESERLKRLQRKSTRQLAAAGMDFSQKKEDRKRVKRSNNWYKTQRQIKKEYAKMDRQKEHKAIEITHTLLSENREIVMQDENLKGWKANGHGKKVQHGVLGRVKRRLMASPRVHVINRWVPTTKLCTSCGRMHDDIKEEDRKFICLHCGHNDGERDTHSAKDMLWLYLNMAQYIGLDGSEYKRSAFDEALRRLFPELIIEQGSGES